MYDIHSHLIPGIDDGARDEAEALSLLRLAEQDGITHMVLTPHIHLGRFDNTLNSIFDAFFQFKLAALANNISIQLAFSAEIRIDAEIIPLLQKRDLPFLGNFESRKVVLLELPHSQYPLGADNLIKWMIKEGITPVIAHPERNRDIQKNTDLILKLKRLGCLFQLTAGSVTGVFGEKPKLLSEWILKNDYADLIASDAHNLKRRPPILSDAYASISNVYGNSYAEKLFVKTPAEITKHLFLC
ncbi:tyrosine-protein phosphatase [Pseudoalteromonas sp.]|uniref:tyrosine-protein phosphatase n=1 Tax=Pseudoalteromonas sp. TaxID=53249 RepID=UPI003562A7A7